MFYTKKNNLNFWFKQSDNLIWKKKSKTFSKKNNKHICFKGSKINIYENLISKHLYTKNQNKICLITVSKNGDVNRYSFKDIDTYVSKAEIYLEKKIILKKVSKVLIRASASIESITSMLLFSKLGIHFSIIFPELGNKALKQRIDILKPDLILSRDNDQNYKFLKKKYSKKTFLFQDKEIKKIKFKEKKKSISYFDGYKSLFTLFTSGSTGQPKGITHTSAGYLLYAFFTCRQKFGINRSSTILTASDAGWINGHTYAVFGPLFLGAQTILLEKPISLLNEDYLKKIISLKPSIVYLPVTLIRLMKEVYGKKRIKKHSILTLGSMGEPLAKSVGEWFSKFFSLENRAIINTYFQTETAGIISSPSFKQSSFDAPNGSVGELVKYLKIVDLKKDVKKEILIKSSWPGIMKTVLNGKLEYNKYWNKEGQFRMFDLGVKQRNNLYIHGRLDDVINIRGHRIGSGEVESILLKNNSVIEACAISLPDKLSGNLLYIFVSTKNNINISKKLDKSIYDYFGSFAIPEKYFYLTEMPKTRSGKILRRMLKNILLNDNKPHKADYSTMMNQHIVKEIIEVVKSE